MITIVPKPTRERPLWLDILFYFSICLLLLSLIAYFGLYYSLKKNEAALQGLDQELSRGRLPEQIALEKEILAYQEKIKNFSSGLFLRQDPLLLFALLESSSHFKVQWTSLNWTANEPKVALLGKADSFQAVGEQIYFFQDQAFIQEVELRQLLLGAKEGTGFGLALFLAPQFFK